jgi:hypothetical protein
VERAVSPGVVLEHATQHRERADPRRRHISCRDFSSRRFQPIPPLVTGTESPKVVQMHRTIVQMASRTLQPGFELADGLVG